MASTATPGLCPIGRHADAPGLAMTRIHERRHIRSRTDDARSCPDRVRGARNRSRRDGRCAASRIPCCVHGCCTFVGPERSTRWRSAASTPCSSRISTSTISTSRRSGGSGVMFQSSRHQERVRYSRASDSVCDRARRRRGTPRRRARHPWNSGAPRRCKVAVRVARRAHGVCDHGLSFGLFRRRHRRLRGHGRSRTNRRGTRPDLGLGPRARPRPHGSTRPPRRCGSFGLR